VRASGFLVSAASVVLLSTLSTLGAEPVDAERLIVEAVTKAGEEPSKQVQALARLAWPDTPLAPQLCARARAEIVAYGERAISPLRVAFGKVKPSDQEDLVRAYIEAFRQMSARIPPDYLPGLEAMVWYGVEGAKRVAIPEIARFRYRGAILTIMDAAAEIPALLPLAAEALGRIGDDRARFFLEKILNEGKPESAEPAAMALAQIGGRALLPLKAGLSAEGRSVRLAAARALLPVARVEDLSALFEYLEAHPDDDPATVQALRQAVIMLDKQRQAQEAAAASSSAPEEKTP